MSILQGLKLTINHITGVTTFESLNTNPFLQLHTVTTFLATPPLTNNKALKTAIINTLLSMKDVVNCPDMNNMEIKNFILAKNGWNQIYQITNNDQTSWVKFGTENFKPHYEQPELSLEQIEQLLRMVCSDVIINNQYLFSVVYESKLIMVRFVANENGMTGEVVINNNSKYITYTNIPHMELFLLTALCYVAS